MGLWKIDGESNRRAEMGASSCKMALESFHARGRQEEAEIQKRKEHTVQALKSGLTRMGFRGAEVKEVVLPSPRGNHSYRHLVADVSWGSDAARVSTPGSAPKRPTSAPPGSRKAYCTNPEDDKLVSERSAQSLHRPRSAAQLGHLHSSSAPFSDYH